MKRGLAALAALAAAFPFFASAEDADFAASKGAGLEAQLHERLRGAVRTIPGTDTEFLVGGYIQVAGLSRHVSVALSTPAGKEARNVDGSGVSISGSLSVLGDDSLLFQAATGKGIGR